MANNHYDVIILGESLASRIAAALLAKAGRRVLTAGLPATNPCNVWIPSSRHLESLYELLGGRCRIASAAPFQVLSGQVRLTLHGSSSLQEELRREFTTDSIRVEQLLHELDNIGNRLEAALLESEGLPLMGWSSRWRFLYKRLFKGLTRRKLAHPLAGKLKAGNSAQTVKALAALFSGLALRPIEHLSVAEGALLWRTFGSSQCISAIALDALLTQLFEQFQGERAALGDLKSVQTAGRRLREAVFINGRRCTAEVFLVGSPDAYALLPAELQGRAAAGSSPPGLEAWTTGGKISPLFAQVVILDGSPPLRLNVEPDSARRRWRVTCQPTAAINNPAAAQSEERISELFPFAALQVEPSAPHPSAPEAVQATRPRQQKMFPGATCSLAAGENLLYCCGKQVLPGLGSTGEIILGISVYNHLQRQQHR